MNFTPELIAAAKTADSPESLIAIAKDHGITLSDSEAALYFRQLRENAPAGGELSDDELDSVSGGGCGGGGNSSPTERYGCPFNGTTIVTHSKTFCPQCRTVQVHNGVWYYPSLVYDYYLSWEDVGSDRWTLECTKYYHKLGTFTGDPATHGFKKKI